MIKPLFVSLAFALSVLMTPAQSSDKKIEAVIGQQIEAFLADDFATAFTYASPMIQQMFGNPDKFGQMVRQGYPMVWRPADVTFLQQRDEGATTVQRVLVEDAAGKLHTLEYYMITGPDGWRINGVTLVQAQVGA